MTRRTQRETGFSFIDVLLALVVLTIGVLALADLQLIASTGNSSSKLTTTAVSVAEQKMEQIKSASYDKIVSEPSTQVTVSGMTFTTQVSVVINSPVSNAKTVTVAVTWTNGAQTSTIPMATIVSQ